LYLGPLGGIKPGRKRLPPVEVTGPETADCCIGTDEGRINMPEEYVSSLRDRKIEHIGNKARNLQLLSRGGFPTPITCVCSWDAYVRSAQGDARVLEDLRTELAAKLDSNKRYAVRSSANLEDGLDLSFAGQFKSVLDVQGADEILKAVQLVWDATQSPSIQAYLGQKGFGSQDLKMAVIIQEMVPARVSGVAFSKNPITGLDEVVVEAIKGSGEALVQDGVTPQRWINKWGTWTELPDDAMDGQGIDLELIEDVAHQTKEIARTYGRPVDLEWVYDGRQVKWVQMREITTLDIPVYSNRLSKEVFPGIIKPLIWSVNVPLVNGAWVALFTELIGPNNIQPETLAGRFYSRAYFDMAALGEIFELLGLPRETLELLMGIEVEGPERPSFKPSHKTYRLLPRMLGFGLDKVRFSRKIEAFLPAMEKDLQAFELRQEEELTEDQLLDRIDRLHPLAQETAYYNTVIALLMRVYNRILKGQLGRVGIDFESFDLIGGIQELDRFVPNVHLARLSQVYRALDENLQERTREVRFEQLSLVPGTEALRSGIEQFLNQFGHLSDSSSDFSQEPWRENPDLILQMIMDCVPPESGVSGRVRLVDLQIPPLRRPFFMWTYNRARRFHWYREAISSLYTYGYGLFRDLFLAMGYRFVRRGLIAQATDVFYLYVDEVREMVEADQSDQDYSRLVRERKDEADRMRNIIPPELIFGDEAPSLDPSQGRGLKGTPTSRGVYTGPVRVLKGIQDMSRVQGGDVLVIPYSDVGWTPMFAKAGAVVAESGGILSHSSIIAREYGIPAVVSVPGACQLADDTQVTVDGHSGRIIVHEAA
jgi:phosphoenolpyruvate synthase/pyruvate phosphate dikinase